MRCFQKKWIVLFVCALFLTGCGFAVKNPETGRAESQQSASQESGHEGREEASADSQADSDYGLPDSAAQQEADSVTSVTQGAGMVPDEPSAKTSSSASAGSKPAASSPSAQASSKPAASSPPAQMSSKPASSPPVQASSKPASSSSAQTNNQQAQLDQLAQQVVALVNSERAKQGLSPLAADAQLAESALVRSQEIFTKFSHERPNGEQGYQLVFRAGFSTVGENIASGYATAEQVMEGWMNSTQGHRENILRPGFTHIGVGCYRASNGQLYWTQLFGG